LELPVEMLHIYAAGISARDTDAEAPRRLKRPSAGADAGVSR
jgi:hypothetical protein